MPNSTQLSKKMAGYSALALSLAGISSNAEAQIFYSNDQTTVIGIDETRNFDLDGDKTNDFSIALPKIIDYISGATYIRYGANISGLQSSNSWRHLDNQPTLVQDFNPGDPIVAGSPNFALQQGFMWNNFQNMEEKYIGVRFFGGGGTQYLGWIRVEVKTATNANMVVKDWAYKEVQSPLTSINAGEGGIATILQNKTVVTDEVEIYPTLVKEEVTIKSKTPQSYQIISSRGEIVSEGLLTEGEGKINTSTFTSGIYLIKLTSSKGLTVEKLIKE